MIGTRPETPLATPGSASSVAGAPSSCLPPWFETHTAAAPEATAFRASSGVSTPFRMTGRDVMERSHRTSRHVSESSRPPMRLEMDACAEDDGAEDPDSDSDLDLDLDLDSETSASTLARRNPAASANLFRTSRSRRPSVGASTVTTSAVAPARSALRTSASTAALSRRTYSWNHMVAPDAFAIASPIRSTLVVDCCEAQYGTRASAHASAAPISPSGCAILCIATGATRMGAADGANKPTLGMGAVSVVTRETSTRHLGQSVTRANAEAFARSVVSVSAPPAK